MQTSLLPVLYNIIVVMTRSCSDNLRLYVQLQALQKANIFFRVLKRIMMSDKL